MEGSTGQGRWFWVTLALSSVTIVGGVFAAWELVEMRFFRDADYVTLHYLYITRGIGSSLLLAFWAAWFVLRERRGAEQQLRRSRERYRGLLESAPGAVALYDRDLTVLEWNALAEQLYGFRKAKVLGAPLPTLLEAQRAEFLEILHVVESGSAAPALETQRYGKDGLAIDVQLNLSLFREDTGEPYFLEVTHDIRERVRLRQTLLQIEKLTTMGQMASGTAHHLNTPLAAMLLRIRMARASHDIGKDLDQLESSVRFCQQFVQRLLDFSRRPESRKQPESLAAIIESVVAFLNPQIVSKKVSVATQVAGLNGALVLADRNELEALLLILLTNAVDAVGAGGEIWVAGRQRGQRLELAVRDNGCGIAAADLPRIFEPFFTTKPAGIGTGLGLAIAHNIAQEHGGDIRVASEPGAGTTVTVDLPLHPGAAERKQGIL